MVDVLTPSRDFNPVLAAATQQRRPVLEALQRGLVGDFDNFGGLLSSPQFAIAASLLRSAGPSAIPQNLAGALGGALQQGSATQFQNQQAASVNALRQAQTQQLQALTQAVPANTAARLLQAQKQTKTKEERLADALELKGEERQKFLLNSVQDKPFTVRVGTEDVTFQRDPLTGETKEIGRGKASAAQPTISSITAPILAKIRDQGPESLTPGERAALDEAQRLDVFDRLLRDRVGERRPSGTQDDPVPVANAKEAEALPSGSWFRTPDGRTLQRR